MTWKPPFLRTPLWSGWAQRSSAPGIRLSTRQYPCAAARAGARQPPTNNRRTEGQIAMASRVTFIGAGNMASAIIGGMLDSGHPATAITATSPSDAFLAPLRERFAIQTSLDNAAAAQNADIVVLAVKPQIMREVCEGLRDTLQQHRPLVISVAAGLTAETLQSWLGGDLPLVRCMPNTPSLVGAGAAGLFRSEEHTSELQS